MEGESDLKFSNGSEFCMRVREEEKVAGFFGEVNGSTQKPTL